MLSSLKFCNYYLNRIYYYLLLYHYFSNLFNNGLSNLFKDFVCTLRSSKLVIDLHKLKSNPDYEFSFLAYLSYRIVLFLNIGVLGRFIMIVTGSFYCYFFVMVKHEFKS